MTKLMQQLGIMAAIAAAGDAMFDRRRRQSTIKCRWRANDGQKRHAADLATRKRRQRNRIARRSRRFNLRHGN